MSTLRRAARSALFSSAIAIGLAACGGGSSAPSPSTPPPNAPSPTPAPPSAPSADEAARFLVQSTFGPTDGDIVRVQEIGYSGWIDEQLSIAPTPHLTYVRANYNLLLFGANFGFMQDSFWQQAITAPDQLRQRVKFALSELVVVSAESGTVAIAADGLANYVDLLGQHAFGNYRALLEAVATSPMMGIYLSHLRNQKADPVSGRVPDENFAREVMQLFSIGLTEINLDGTPKLVNGQSVETYTNADITGLARVFTGWSWAAQDTVQCELQRRRHRVRRSRRAADAAISAVPRDRREDLSQRDDPRQHVGAGQPEDRARYSVQPPEPVPVHRPAASSAAGDQQPLACLCRTRVGRLRQQRRRCSRRHEGDRAHDPARQRGARQRRLDRPAVRQAA